MAETPAEAGARRLTDDLIMSEFRLLREVMSGRFDAQDRAIASLQEDINRRFAAQQENTNRRFADLQEDINRRFADQQENMNHRFEAQQSVVKTQLDSVNKRFGILLWVMGIFYAGGLSLLGLILTELLIR